MLEFLSDKSWLAPQINFLLSLQNIRVNCPEFVNNLSIFITSIGETLIPMLICAIFYWCINAKDGIFLFSLFGFQYILSQLLKMLACVYRPWILDSNIHPPESVYPHSRNYSFPSGHSSMVASNLGGICTIIKNNPIRTFLIFLILLVGFSRMWLGVHTPQDIIVGFLIGITLIFIVKPLIDLAEKNKNLYLYILGLTNVIALGIMIYLAYFHHCPVDYVNGEVIVNPYKSFYAIVVTYGCSLGILNGLYLCRRFFPFDPQEASIKARILRGIIGAILVTVLYDIFIEKYIIQVECNYKFAFIVTFMIGIFVTLIYPVIFSKIKFLNK